MTWASFTSPPPSPSPQVPWPSLGLPHLRGRGSPECDLALQCPLADTEMTNRHSFTPNAGLESSAQVRVGQGLSGHLPSPGSQSVSGHLMVT